MEYIRKQFYTLKERILEPRKFMQVLAGPRQVGKSTLVNQVLAQVAEIHQGLAGGSGHREGRDHDVEHLQAGPDEAVV